MLPIPVIIKAERDALLDQDEILDTVEEYAEAGHSVRELAYAKCPKDPIP